MRLKSCALAWLVISIAGCSMPCRDRNLVLIGTGGPVGAIVAALDQCRDADPPPPVPEPVASLPDMATLPPDLASAPDMVPAPDLIRPPLTVDLALGPWQVRGPLTAQSEAGFTCSAAFDWASSAPIPCAVEIPIRLPADAAQAKSILLTYGIGATLAWQPLTNCGFVKGYLVRQEQSNTSVCIQPILSGGLVIDGTSASPTTTVAMPASFTAKPPQGFSYPVDATTQLSLRFSVSGDVAVTGLSPRVTATLSF